MIFKFSKSAHFNFFLRKRGQNFLYYFANSKQFRPLIFQDIRYDQELYYHTKFHQYPQKNQLLVKKKRLLPKTIPNTITN